jgi:hypothetical protein
VLGTLVSSGNSWPTTFTLSSALTAGVTNYLHIEAINYGGPAIFIGDFTLSDTGFKFANGSQTLLTDTTDWSGSYNNGNSDPSQQQTWIQPTGGVTSFGTNGAGPWGTLSNISSSAQFIWPDDSNSFPDPGAGDNGVCGFCTVDFSTPKRKPPPRTLRARAADAAWAGGAPCREDGATDFTVVRPSSRQRILHLAERQ